MVDRSAFDIYARRDFVGLFRLLNGMPMYDILDTLDALLKERSYYPRADQNQPELQAAGIFVKRLEVAMAAVLHKNARQMSIADFNKLYQEQLAMLPPDQREAIAKYFTGGGGSGISTGELVDQYLRWAKDAVFKTQMLLPRGSFNKPGDFFKGSPIAIVQTRGVSANAAPETVARAAMNAKGGNCDEFSAVAYVCLKNMGIRPIDWYKLDPAVGDHAFVLIGRPLGVQYIDQKDLAKWGAKAVVCDAWLGDAYLASDIPRRMKDAGLKGPFKAMTYGSAEY